MQHTTQFNSLDFILQGGFVSISVALILVLMSVASWYFIIVKTLQMIKIKHAIKNDTQIFWQSPTLANVVNEMQTNSAISRLSTQAIEASVHHQTHQAKALDGMCNHEEFVARSMRRNLSAQMAEYESGLSVLASVGSVAPFVGLFGTVWGIYHALATISISGQATLDKVAGPVGEALIMTAIGLAVAIPAVLAYNAFVKTNRNTMASLESFAQDLHNLLTTGAPLVIKSTAEKKSSKKINTSADLHEVTA